MGEDGWDTQVISIERYTGRLLYSGQPGIDLFSTPRDALQFITKGNNIVKNVVKCHTIIGYYTLGSMAYLIVVTKVSSDLTLPPNHKVYTVQEAQWLKIPLGYPYALTKQEVKNANVMTEFQLNGLHFYCETLDITRPFPSVHAPEDYDPEFCWNHSFLTQEFRRIGMRKWCCVLLQGIAVGKLIPCKEVLEGINLNIIARRSSLNPGTRYHSRGLNSSSSPGNEYEVEQSLWKSDSNGIIHWSSVLWRRGTVPIHWRSELNNAVTDAEIIIGDRPYENIDQYYKRLSQRYGNQPITILNLLRSKSVHPQEGVLAEHYRDSLEVVKKLMAINIDMIDYDWHHINKSKGMEMAVEGLWKQVGPKIRSGGVTSGLIRSSSNGNVIESKILRKQNGILRVNCADSLDRTNLSTFFNGIHYLAEQCRQLGISLCVKEKSEFSEAWSSLSYNLEKVKQIFDSTLLLYFAEIYIHKGDVCATLFTNTVAMHTGAIREFATHLPSAPSNAKILVERRIQNVLKDKTRQAQYEMLLGLNWNKYFPSYLKYLSRSGKLSFITSYPSYIFKTIPQEVSLDTTEEYSLLTQCSSKYCWICPRDYDYIEVNIFLPYYCRVNELAITVRHGMSEVSSPSKMDVFVGTHIDECLIGFQEMNIPRCEDGTKLLYTLPSQISGIAQNSIIYDFEGSTPKPKMRVVRITFYGIPPAVFMTIGQIQIFGINQGSLDPIQFGFNLKQHELNQKLSNMLSNLNISDLEITSPIHEIGNVPSNSDDKQMLDVTNNEISVSDTNAKTTFSENNASDKKYSSDHSNNEYVHKMEGSENVQNDYESDEDDNEDEKGLNSTDAQVGVVSNYFTVPKSVQDISSFLQDSNESLNTNSLQVLANGSSNSNHISTEMKEIDSQVSSIMEAKTKYTTFLMTKCPKASTKISFTDALELDLARMKLGLTPAMRDAILVEHGLKVVNFDPNKFVYRRDEKVEKAICKKNKTASKNCTMCSTSITFGKYVCHYCRLTFCKNCTSKEKKNIIEYCWKTSQQVCIECCDNINKQQKLIKEIREIMARKKKEEKSKPKNTYDQLFNSMFPSPIILNRSIEKDVNETILSEFPCAGILSSVETDMNSPPIESILFPNDMLNDEYWYSPSNVHSVRFIVVLPCYASLSRIAIQTDKLGYHNYDLFDIRLSFAERLPQFFHQMEWKLCEEEGYSNEESYDELVIQPHSDLELPINIGDVKSCRLIQFELTLRKQHTQTVDVQQKSKDELDKIRIHLGRLKIFGKVLLPSENIQPLLPKKQSLYDSIMRMKPKSTRIALKCDSKFTYETNTIDLTIINGKVVSGFRIIVEHGANGITTQVKDIRVSMLSYEKKELVSQNVIGTFTVPKVVHGASLFFDFDKTLEQVSIVRFEFLNNYGAEEICQSKISLYSMNVSM